MTERWSGDTNGRWIFGRLLVQAMKTICANLLSEGLSAQRLVAGWLAAAASNFPTLDRVHSVYPNKI